MDEVIAVSEPTNDGADTIETALPYIVEVKIKGSSDLIFHRWSDEAVEAQQKAAKGSKGKKKDNVEAYVYRDDKGHLCIPGMNFRASIIEAARYRQDPRSSRKSATDLFKAAIVPLTILAPIGKGVKAWDYLDKRRVTVMRAGITRVRPAMHEGWEATFQLLVNLPEYIPVMVLREVIEQAGRLVGLCDNRPTFGRFGIISFKQQPV